MTVSTLQIVAWSLGMFLDGIAAVYVWQSVRRWRHEVRTGARRQWWNCACCCVYECQCVCRTCASARAARREWCANTTGLSDAEIAAMEHKVALQVAFQYPNHK